VNNRLAEKTAYWQPPGAETDEHGGTSYAARRLHLEQLPAYAPELNPDEGIWNYLKRVELGNQCCHDLAELTTVLRRAKERLRHKRAVIQGCITQAGYHASPSRRASGIVWSR